MGSLKRGENMFEEMTIYYEDLVTSKEKLDFITGGSMLNYWIILRQISSFLKRLNQRCLLWWRDMGVRSLEISLVIKILIYYVFSQGFSRRMKNY